MIIDMSLEQRKSYLDDEGKHCPYCGNENIQKGQWHVENGEALVEVECKDCTAYWTEIWHLVGVDDLSI